MKSFALIRAGVAMDPLRIVQCIPVYRYFFGIEIHVLVWFLDLLQISVVYARYADKHILHSCMHICIFNRDITFF